VKPRKSISMLFAVLLIALAVVARAADVRMEPSVNTFSSTKWLKEKASIENDVIQTTFALKHNKAALADFERTLLEISNPKSANYGKWLSVSNAIFRRPDFCFTGLAFIHLFSATRSRLASPLLLPASRPWLTTLLLSVTFPLTFSTLNMCEFSVLFKVFPPRTSA
jgi:hypothetical protein